MRSYTTAGFWKYLQLKVRGRTILVQGSCRACGSCCKKICLEGQSGWLRSPQEFYRMVDDCPEYQRFKIVGTDRQGLLLFNCSWSTVQGTCMDYENRLAICCNFPERSLAFVGGSLPYGCGYRFTEVVPFEKILQKELNKTR